MFAWAPPTEVLDMPKDHDDAHDASNNPRPPTNRKQPNRLKRRQLKCR